MTIVIVVVMVVDPKSQLGTPCDCCDDGDDAGGGGGGGGCNPEP